MAILLSSTMMYEIKVIVITSMKHSTQVTSRQKDGKKLYEVADLVIDNQADYGDAGQSGGLSLKSGLTDFTPYISAKRKWQSRS